MVRTVNGSRFPEYLDGIRPEDINFANTAAVAHKNLKFESLITRGVVLRIPLHVERRFLIVRKRLHRGKRN